MGISRKELLKKIAGATVSGGGNNIRDGRYRLAIKKLAFEEGFKGTRFVSEHVVVASSKIPVMELKTNKMIDVEPNPVGSDVSIVQMVEKHDSAVGNIKAYVLALFGMEGEEVTDEDFMETLDELTTKNTAKGMVIDCETYRRVTDKNKVEIVLPKWFRVEQTEQDIVATMRWMESLTLGTTAVGGGASAQA